MHLGLRKNLISKLRQQGINEKVLHAMSLLPRSIFVEEALESQAYENVTLPIGESQTISQPYISAKMTELLQLNKNDKVLEIGTGCGYQTALLALLAEQIFSVERIKKLQIQALRRLNKLELYNIKLKHGDGWEGWPQYANYDAILVTAAATEIPEKLLAQLTEGGRLLLPLVKNGKQMLHRITKINNRYQLEIFDEVYFVPLVAGDTE